MLHARLLRVSLLRFPAAIMAALGVTLWAMPALAQCPLSFVSAANYAASDGPFTVAVGDFNADGQPDMAVANVNSDNVSVFLNTFCLADFNCSDEGNSQDFFDSLAAYFAAR